MEVEISLTGVPSTTHVLYIYIDVDVAHLVTHWQLAHLLKMLQVHPVVRCIAVEISLLM